MLYQDKVVDGLNMVEIAEKYGVSPTTIKNRCVDFGFDTKRKCISRLMTEEDVRRMYVDERMSITEIAAYYDTIYCGTLIKAMREWGIETSRADGSLRRSQIKRWGKQDKNSQLCSAYLRRIKSRAKRKGLDYDIDANFIVDLYKKQNGRCALSGLDISLPKTNRENTNHLYTATVDKIDPINGYTRDNVQLLHKDINRMKYTHSKGYLLELCELIVKNQKKVQ